MNLQPHLAVTSTNVRIWDTNSVLINKRLRTICFKMDIYLHMTADIRFPVVDGIWIFCHPFQIGSGVHPVPRTMGVQRVAEHMPPLCAQVWSKPTRTVIKNVVIVCSVHTNVCTRYSSLFVDLRTFVVCIRVTYCDRVCPFQVLPSRGSSLDIVSS